MFYDEAVFKHIVPFLTHRPKRGLEIHRAPVEVIKEALEWEANCPNCGKPTHLVRTRGQNGDDRTPLNGVYVTVSCPPSENVACCRTSAARDAVGVVKQRMREATLVV